MSMMSPKKAKKNREREKEAKKKVLKRRQELRAPKIEENKLRKRIKRIEKLQKEVAGLELWSEDVILKMNEKTLSQLERNAEILKALEEEYEKEQAKKRQLNEDLESRGMLTLEEKLNHLHQELVGQQQSDPNALAEEVELAKQFASLKEPKEVAEVTVLKAPGFEAENSEKDQN